MAEVVIEEALGAVDVVGGGGSGASDGFGAYGIAAVGIEAVPVTPCCIVVIHPHAVVIIISPGGATRIPVCERAVVHS